MANFEIRGSIWCLSGLYVIFVCRSQAWVQWNSFRSVASQQEAKTAGGQFWHVPCAFLWGMGQIHYEHGCDAKILSTLLNAKAHDRWWQMHVLLMLISRVIRLYCLGRCCRDGYLHIEPWDQPVCSEHMHKLEVAGCHQNRDTTHRLGVPGTLSSHTVLRDVSRRNYATLTRWASWR